MQRNRTENHIVSYSSLPNPNSKPQNSSFWGFYHYTSRVTEIPEMPVNISPADVLKMFGENVKMNVDV